MSPTVEGQREAVGPALGPHLVDAVVEPGEVVVLDAGEVPQQPGDVVGARGGTAEQQLLVGAVEDVVDVLLDASEEVDQQGV